MNREDRIKNNLSIKLASWCRAIRRGGEGRKSSGVDRRKQSVVKGARLQISPRIVRREIVNTNLSTRKKENERDAKSLQGGGGGGYR